MKKLLIGLFALATTVSFGQIRRGNNVVIQPQFGIYGGLSASNQWQSNGDGTGYGYNTLAGGIGGVQLALPISYGWYIQPEVNFTNMGSKFYESDADYEGSVRARFNYLNVPILFKYQEPFTGIGIFFGPQYGYLLSAHNTATGPDAANLTTRSVDVKSQYHNSEVAGVFGLEYYFPNNGRPGPKFGFSARYQFGFTNINNNAYTNDDGSVSNYQPSLRNDAFFLTFGIRF